MIKAAVIFSGGDGSGVNAAIETIVKDREIKLYGFHDGFNGILYNEPIPLTQSICQNRILDGKQILRTSRSKIPLTKEGRKRIKEKIADYNFDYLVIFGGNGSQQAAKLLNNEGIKTFFAPMTIDNDVCGSDYSIGFDTALNRVVSVIHDLHDTAYNMPGRIFMIEVLGGDCGNLALGSALAGGCDLAIIPEFSTDRQKIVESISEKLEDKESIIIVCSESAYEKKDYVVGNQGVSFEIAKHIEEKLKIRVRKTVVGFYIRSGIPTFKDALIAVQMGNLIRKGMRGGQTGKMVGVNNDIVQLIDYKDIELTKPRLNSQWVELALQNNLIIK